MSKYPAKKVHTTYGKYANIVWYEYRGDYYCVEYSNYDDHLVTPAYIQHKREQEGIDLAIERAQTPPKEQESDAQDAFDEFMKFVDGEESIFN